jgi:predicted O-linked N-acetylglucosamine transferase (SPINDLY family)
MGVPLVTCQGETFAGRVASSLLAAAGLSELIATDLDQYQALALDLATDPRASPGAADALEPRPGRARPSSTASALPASSNRSIGD